MHTLLKLLTTLRLRKKKCTVLIVGLDNSGKSTILNHLKSKNQKREEIVPTVGFSVDVFRNRGVEFKAFDMSGAGKYRTLWEKYFEETHAVIFVVDSADRLRLAIAKEEVQSMLDNPDLKHCPMLFMANKQDIEDALTPQEIAVALHVCNSDSRPWHIVPTKALRGEGIDNGISWLIRHLL